MAELGIADSREEVLTYLASLSHDMIDEKLAAAYVDAGPEMIRWLEANTPATFRIVQDFPDYHPEHPGGSPAGAARWSARCSPSTSSARGPPR